MAREKSPAFQFYPKEFLADGNVSGMSLQERGAYITLICICWNDGSLPMATERLANMVGTPHRQFLKFWPVIRTCFAEQGGRYVHPRLEREREKQEQYRRRQSDAGKRSASTRRQPESNHGSTTVQPRFNQTHNQTATTGQPEPNSPISYLQSPDWNDGSVIREV